MSNQKHRIEINRFFSKRIRIVARGAHGSREDLFLMADFMVHLYVDGIDAVRGEIGGTGREKS